MGWTRSHLARLLSGWETRLCEEVAALWPLSHARRPCFC